MRSARFGEGPGLAAFLDRQALPGPLGHSTLKNRYVRVTQFCHRARGGLAERSTCTAAVKDDLGGPVLRKHVPVSRYSFSGDIDGSGNMGNLILLGHADVNERNITFPGHRPLDLFGTNDDILRLDDRGQKKC